MADYISNYTVIGEVIVKCNNIKLFIDDKSYSDYSEITAFDHFCQ